MAYGTEGRSCIASIGKHPAGGAERCATVQGSQAPRPSRCPPGCPRAPGEGMPWSSWQDHHPPLVEELPRRRRARARARRRPSRTASARSWCSTRCWSPLRRRAAGWCLFRATLTNLDQARGTAMEFEYSKKTKCTWSAHGLMNKHVRGGASSPAARSGARDGRFPPSWRSSRPRRAARAVEISPSESERGAGLTNLEYRAALRDHGALAIAPESFQLLGAPTPATWRPSSATHAEQKNSGWSRSSKADPFRLRHDRAQGRLVGRHQQRVQHHAGRRPLHDHGHKWWTSASSTPLQDPHLHGQTDAKNSYRYKQQSMILVPP